MKNSIKIGLVLLVLVGALAAWLLIGSGTGFSGSRKYLYIRSNAATKEAVMDSIRENGIVSSPRIFDFIASRIG